MVRALGDVTLACSPPSLNQFARDGGKIVERKSRGAMEDHQRIHIGQCVHFSRQGALLPLRRPHPAPVVNGLFEFGECQVHAAILPALGSEAEPQLIRDRNHEVWTQVAHKGGRSDGCENHAEQAKAQPGSHVVCGSRFTAASLIGRLSAQAARPSAIVISQTVS